MASAEYTEATPPAGQWPVPPQEDAPLDPAHIWIDGCFDFFHHGHAGVMLQARQLGTELWVGIHSDGAILKNKGPTVMTLAERVAAVEACRWATAAVPHAPYVTQLSWISHYGCQFVVHGDDMTSDSAGEDCYRFVKHAGRFKVVTRTPGISTTDLVGRMLLCTKNHFVKDLLLWLDGREGEGSEAERRARGSEIRQRLEAYATDESGLKPGAEVWLWKGQAEDGLMEKGGTCQRMVTGGGPRPGQRVVYVDGGFDLFCSGHIEFLRQVVAKEEEHGRQRGWYEEHARQKRIEDTGKDYPPGYVVAGVHDDGTINHWKGVNYPIMNIFERGLCVLQCKYINLVLFSAPFEPTSSFLHALPYGLPAATYHGSTNFTPLPRDPYLAPTEMGIFNQIPPHAYSHVNAGEVVDRIMKSRQMYEERQRVKGVKGLGEEAVQRREEMEKEAEAKRAVSNGRNHPR